MVEEKLHKQQWLEVARWAAGGNPALLAALALRAACCCVCPVGAGLGAMLRHWGYAGFLIFPCLCVTAVCDLFVMWCLLEGSALHRRSNADVTLALQDILVCVPYLCSHLSCFVQDFPFVCLFRV